MTTFLLYSSIVILSWLSLYAFFYAVLSLRAIFLRFKKSAVTEKIADGEVAVLIPARNEGEAVLDALSSVINQDYRGRIAIYVLLKDENDSSWPFLQKKINDNKSDWHRKINVLFCGEEAKSKKLNYALKTVNSPYIAILDADHRPSANWLSSSLRIMLRSEVDVVQSRRAPLELSTLPQIWDSGQNHGGNEIFNFNLSLSGENVFFTGTAALFRLEVLRKFSFSDSLTEDTFLSHDILLSGLKISYNKEAVSYEEVSPSLRAYVFRRRRWGAGHNHSFFKHFVGIFSAKLSMRQKVILFFHGAFYLLPLFILFLLNIYGWHFLGQLSFNYQSAIFILSLFLSFVLTYLFKQGSRISVPDFLVAFVYLWPQIAMLSILFLRFSGSLDYFYILSFPLSKDLALWQIILFSAPLWPLAASAVVFKSFRKKRNLWLLLTYPIAVFLDIYAILLGFVDFIFGKSYWSTIARTNRHSASLLPKDVNEALSVSHPKAETKSGGFYWLVFAAFATIVLLNDLLASNNCGQVKKFLWPPVFIRPASDLNLDINIAKKDLGGSGLSVSAPLFLSGAPDNFNMEIYLDGELKEKRKVENGRHTVFEAEYPYGFNGHEIIFNFQSDGISNQASCYRKFYFTDTMKELRGKDLFVNGEKFLIKGLIPSFLGAKSSLPLVDGLRQLKEAGANTVRFYHGANKEIMSAAASAGLMVIDQPNQSTWGDFNPENSYQSDKFINRYKDLLKEHEGQAFSLFTSFGNEWELGQKRMNSAISGSIAKLLKQGEKEYPNPLSSYSTYYTFADYPVAISAVNMLDTGRTYWGDALNMLKASTKPFYASEFGGFVAFFEKTPAEIRYNRLLTEWNELIESGALGANVFESHDNWAQPLVEGYNDPAKDEQADDKRGFWTNNNEEKLELGALKIILSDVSITVNRGQLKKCSEKLSVNVKNKREYGLKGVVLFYRDYKISLGDFKAGESRDFDLDLGNLSDSGFSMDILLRYTTHSGIDSASSVRFIPICHGAPVLVLNSDFQSEKGDGKVLKGRLIASGSLDVFLPDDWSQFSLNGKEYKRSGDFINLEIGGPYYNANEVFISRDMGTWQPFDQNNKLKDGGLFYVKFTWPNTASDDAVLLLGGLGANKVNFYIDSQPKSFDVHSYRENIIYPGQIGNPKPGDTVIFSIDRNQTMYVMKMAENNYQIPFLTNKDIPVYLEKPRVFSPAIVNLEKIP